MSLIKLIFDYILIIKVFLSARFDGMSCDVCDRLKVLVVVCVCVLVNVSHVEHLCVRVVSAFILIPDDNLKALCMRIMCIDKLHHFTSSQSLFPFACLPFLPSLTLFCSVSLLFGPFRLAAIKLHL